MSRGKKLFLSSLEFSGIDLTIHSQQTLFGGELGSLIIRIGSTLTTEVCRAKDNQIACIHRFLFSNALPDHVMHGTEGIRKTGAVNYLNTVLKNPICITIVATHVAIIANCYDNVNL